MYVTAMEAGYKGFVIDTEWKCNYLWDSFSAGSTFPFIK